nr:hypothetical protein [Tanacetum cinerariifolium]
MSKDLSILRRNKINWHYVRDDHMFSTIKLVFRHQNTQQFGALLPIELTNEEIRNSNAYKEYYAIAIGAAPPKPKDSVWRTRSSSDTSITPPTATAGTRLTSSQKGKQAAKASKAKSLSALSEVAMTEAQQLKLVTKRSLQQTHISQASSSGADEGTGDDDEGKDGDGDEEDHGDDGEDQDGDDDDGEESDDDQEVVRDDAKDDEKDDEEEGGNDKQGYDEETRDEESFNPILQTPKNSNDEGNGEEDFGLNVGREEGHDEEEEEDELYRDSSSVSSQFVTSMLNSTLDVGMVSIFETTSQMDAQTPTSVTPLPMIAPTMTPSIISTITTTSQAPLPPTTALSTIIQNLPNFGSLFGFDNRLRTLEANFSEFMQTNQFVGPSDKLREEAQKENAEFLKTIDENMQNIIKEQVKEQVNVQVSKILLRIEQTVNEQLEAEVLTQSSHSSRTSYVVAADLFDMELKKILIEKIEGNKSIQRSDEQRRHDDDADKDEEPSTGPDRGSKRRREGKEPESASAPTETATRSAGRSNQGTRSRQASASESAFAEEPMQTTFQMEEPSHPEFDIGAEDQPVIQSSQHPKWFSQQQKPPTLDRDWNKTVPAIHESTQP